MSEERHIDVAGYCPMGCGMTLVLAGQEWAGEGNVICTAAECPAPDAVFRILQNPETEHIVSFSEEHFTVTHPLRERLGDMAECDLHQWLASLAGPPVQPGRYRALRDGDTWRFERTSA